MTKGTSMDFNNFFQSKIFKAIVFTIAVLIIFLTGLKAGTFIGFRKANFSYRWSDNYQRNFAGPKDGFFVNFRDDFKNRDFIQSAGVFGQIIKIENDKLIIIGKNNAETIVLITDKTIINRFQETISVADLKIDDAAVIIGEPNNAGQIEAKLIRVMPAPPR